MRVLFNFSAIKKGGGQNVTFNTLEYIYSNCGLNNYYYFVAKGSPIHQYLVDKKCVTFFSLPQNPVFRILYEIFLCRKFLFKNKIDIIFSYFGFGLFPKKIPQVIGSADSNLYFPEIDFWKEYSWHKRIIKFLIDRYRIYGLYRANGVIFENSILESRCKLIYNIRARTTTILPSINLDFNSTSEKFELNIPSNNSRVGLFLCGWHLNKNVMLIPEIAKYLKINGIDFHFIITAPIDNSDIQKEFVALVEKYKVADMISIVGTIKKEHLKSLYEKIDFVFLLSKLESFSNNIIEAWAYKKVLIISDELWARSICMNAAVYVKRDDPDSIGQQIIELLNDNDFILKLINYGENMFISYPDISSKFDQEKKFLIDIYENS